MKTLFRFPFRSRDEVRSDVEDEFAFHLDMRTADLVREGLDERTARAQALREFGNRRRGAEACTAIDQQVEHRRRMATRLGEMHQDLRFAVRLLWRRPAFTMVAVLTLALGTGANTAIFSVFEQVLVRPLPVAAPRQLVNLSAPGIKPGSDSCNEAGDCDVVFSYPMFRDLQREQTSFTGIAAHRALLANVSYDGRASSGLGMLVSGNYFSLLGLTPTIGRLLGPEDDVIEDAGDAVVLSHDHWTSTYGADPDVLGRSLVVNGRAMTIVGVGPAGFTGTTLGLRPIAFVPLSMARTLQPGNDNAFERRRYWLYLFARLRPGVTPDEAQVAINRPYRDILTQVEAPLETGLSERQMGLFRSKRVTVEPGARGQSTLHASVGTPVALLLLVTATVLLVACANIANLLLARSTERASEMAVRLSIGASRGQLVSLLLCEACVLALAGGAAGLLVARWTLASLAALLPHDGAITLAFALDTRAVLFALLLSVATGLAFGLYPALHSTRRDLLGTLKDRAGQPSGARAAARFRAALVVVQIALATTLLVSAGLFTRSLLNVTRVDLGLDAGHVATFRLLPILNGYEPDRAHRLFEQLEDDLAALPGVTSAAASLMPILSSATTGGNIRVEGFDNGPDSNTNIRYNEVGADYLGTLGMTLLAGRSFTTQDAPGTPRVAVVNEAFVRKFNLGDNAIGTRLADWTSPDEGFDTEIVGVVKDARYSEVKAEVPPTLLRPYRQSSPRGYMVFYVRSSSPPDHLLGALRGAVARHDPYLAVEALKTLPQQVNENVYVDRMVGFLSAAYAIVATLLAAVGLYGVLAYTVGQRTREIGLRMALGADASRVRAMVLGQVTRMTLAGAGLGVVGALGVGRAAQSLLFELDGHDPLVVSASVALLAAVALVAGYLPARRASRIEPMQALRWE
jgi:predicted permease